MKKSIFALVLLFVAGMGSFLHALSIDPKSVHAVVDGKIYRAGVNDHKSAYGAKVTDFSYACSNAFTMVINAYKNFEAQNVSCKDGRNIVYVGARWQDSSRDDIAAAELRRGGKVIVHCKYGVDASNLVAWIGAARARLITAQQASDGFYRGQKGSLGDAKYRQMAAMILKRGS
jgi:hypothetical protein